MADIEKMPSGEADYVDLFYHENNAAAKNLYASFGFIDSGIIQGHSVHSNKQLGLKTTETAVE